MNKKQACKPRSYASLKLRPNQRLTSLKCRATSIAKNVSLFCTYYVVCFDKLMGVFYCTTCCGGRMSWPWRGCCDSLHFGHTSFASKKGFQHRMRRFWGGHFRMSFKGLSTSFRLKPLLGIKIFSGLQFIKTYSQVCGQAFFEPRAKMKMICVCMVQIQSALQWRWGQGSVKNY